MSGGWDPYLLKRVQHYKSGIAPTNKAMLGLMGQ